MLKSPSGGLLGIQITVFGNPPKRRLIKWHFKTKPLPAKTVIAILFFPLVNRNSMQKKDFRTNHKDVLHAGKFANNVQLVIPTAVKDKCFLQHVQAAVYKLRFPLSLMGQNLFIAATVSKDNLKKRPRAFFLV
ncbi:MAG: hypothetical protein VR72_10160 [Clostridiaceae bacterium BRH_c20a]|nr:MAG: hypothetical protein VR72_10160 [Clostridiaceae bacterium BRH_c20a]